MFFTITKQEIKALEMKQAINKLFSGAGVNVPVALTSEVALMWQHGRQLVAFYQGKEIQIDVAQIEKGRWVLIGAYSQTVATRVLDALNTLC